MTKILDVIKYIEPNLKRKLELKVNFVILNKCGVLGRM